VAFGGAVITMAIAILGRCAVQAQTGATTPDSIGARDRAKPAVHAAPDTARVDLRVVPRGAIDRFRGESDFDYGRQLEAPESLWNVIMRKIAQWMRDLMGADGVTTFWDVVTYVIVGAALLFVVLRLLDADTRSLFFRSKKAETAGAAEIDEDVRTIDFHEQIARALATGDFRLAVRLHYLRLLRDLDARGTIAWRRDKTDGDYLREVGDAPMRSGFERATLLFEYVWYGDFPIDRRLYDQIAAVIDRIATVPAGGGGLVDAR
jgi:hypothetical protein